MSETLEELLKEATLENFPVDEIVQLGCVKAWGQHQLIEAQWKRYGPIMP